jgi:hypothetical protein
MKKRKGKRLSGREIVKFFASIVPSVSWMKGASRFELVNHTTGEREFFGRKISHVERSLSDLLKAPPEDVSDERDDDKRCLLLIIFRFSFVFRLLSQLRHLSRRLLCSSRGKSLAGIFNLPVTPLTQKGNESARIFLRSGIAVESISW